jgi:beta-glucosidase
MPPKQLKGFQKLPLGPGECSGVGFPLTAADLQIWDVVAQQWQLVPGTYSLSLGSSSRDIRLTGSLSVTA